MILKEVTLQNFRNYPSLSVSFSDGINVFLGENAQGKTNLMEAIYALALARSPRTSNEKEMIRWQEDSAKITGKIQKRVSTFPLEIIFSKKGKIASAIVNIDLFEDLLLLADKNYLNGIKKARKEYENGDFFTHDQVFGSL